MPLQPKLVSEISLLDKPCQEKSATPVKTDQEKVLLSQTCQGKSASQSFDRFALIDLIDFRSSSMFCLTRF